MAKYKVNNGLSIAHSENKDFLSSLRAKGVIGVDSRMSNSAPMITTPNINAPLGALNYIRPKAIEVLVAPMVADRIAEAQKNGSWGDKSVTIKIKEYMGTVSTDDGREADGLKSSVNYSTELRGAYYYQSSWEATDLEEAQVGAMQENYRADQAEASMRGLRIARNNFFFTGVDVAGNSLPIYGMLNDPNLPAYKSIAKAWDDNATPEEIYNSIVTMIAEVNKTSKGYSTESVSAGRGKYKLAVASDIEPLLDKANIYGLTARVKLKEAYGDKLEVIATPQLNKAESNSDAAYLIFEERELPTFLNSYVEMARAYPMFVKDSVVSQKISAGTSGAVACYPLFVARFSGLSK